MVERSFNPRLKSPNVLRRWAIGLFVPGLMLTLLPRNNVWCISSYSSPESLCWVDLKPDRDEEVAPVLDLGGEWVLQLKEKTSTTSVPSGYAGYQGKVLFRKRFRVPPEWQDRFLVLHFLGIQHRATFRLNDALLGQHQGAGIPFDVPLANQVVRFGGENELAVEVDNVLSATSSLPLRSSVFAPRNFGGITRAVFLQALPRERIGSLEVEQVRSDDASSTSDQGSSDSSIELNLSLLTDEQSGPAELNIVFYDSAGKEVVKTKMAIQGSPGQKLVQERTRLEVKKAQFWRPGRPYRYRLVVTLTRDKQVLDRLQRAIGLREFFQGSGEAVVQGTAAWIGGGSSPVQGVVRVEQWPHSGVSASGLQLEEEIHLIQDLGVRFVRCAFMPPHPYFLELCDSLGIGVFVEIPLFGVSDQMLVHSEVKSAALAAMGDLQVLAKRHPSIQALGWGSNLEPVSVADDGRISSWAEQLPSQLPYYAVTLEVPSRPASIILIDPSRNSTGSYQKHITEILAFMGPLSGAQGNLQQAHRATQALSQLPSNQSPFFVGFLSDWTGNRPLLYDPPWRSPYWHAAGLTDSARRPRVAFFRIKDYLRSGEIEEITPSHPSEKEPPWEFLVFGAVFCVLGLWMMSVDKLLRKNLRRALAHPHGFFADIRDRRFLQGSQTLLLGLLISAGIGNLWASQWYSWRLLSGFSACMEHLVGSDTALAIVQSFVWEPLQGSPLASLVILVLSLVVAMAIRIGSYRQKSRVNLIQSLYILFWAAIPALVILPLSALYLRFYVVPTIQWGIILLVAWALIWSYLRLLRAMQICYRSRFGRPLLVGFVLPLLLIAIYLIRLQATRETFDYIGYFIQLFKMG